MPIRLLLAEDHVMVRQGLRALLEQAGMVVIGEASDGPEALRLARAHQPEVAILDIAMPLLNGLETARRLREAVPQTKTIVLTMHTEEPYILEALQAGVVGYVLKTQAAVDIVQAIQTALQGAIYLSPRVTNAVVQAYLAGVPVIRPADLARARSCPAHRRGADDKGDRSALGAEHQNGRVTSHQPHAEAGHS